MLGGRLLRTAGGEGGIYPQEDLIPQGSQLSLRGLAPGLTRSLPSPRRPIAAQTSEFEAAGPPGQAQPSGSGGHSLPTPRPVPASLFLSALLVSLNRTCTFIVGHVGTGRKRVTLVPLRPSYHHWQDFCFCFKYVETAVYGDR